MEFFAQVPEGDLPEFVKLMQKNHIQFNPHCDGFYKTKSGKTIYTFMCEKTRRVGRPKKQVDMKKIRALKEEGKTVKEICEILDLKRATYYHYLKNEEEKPKQGRLRNT